MAEPKKRHTSTRSGNRRSHLAIKSKSLQNCPKCNEKIIPHRVCKNCGYYNGIDILELERKEKEKKERRKQEEEDEEKKNE
jgi:large subunit ribosomal protein L32